MHFNSNMVTDTVNTLLSDDLPAFGSVMTSRRIFDGMDQIIFTTARDIVAIFEIHSGFAWVNPDSESHEFFSAVAKHGNFDLDI